MPGLLPSRTINGGLIEWNRRPVLAGASGACPARSTLGAHSVQLPVQFPVASQARLESSGGRDFLEEEIPPLLPDRISEAGRRALDDAPNRFGDDPGIGPVVDVFLQPTHGSFLGARVCVHRVRRPLPRIPEGRL